MNIAVFGWYHHRNAGDDRIQQCITRWLDGHTLAFLPAGRKPPIHLLRTYDAAIIGGGGLIMNEGGLFKNTARWVRSCGIPVALMGVSVERITPGLRAELKALLDICCFAWFRDEGSLQEVGPHPKAFVAPDLTWLYPFPVLPPVGTQDSIALCLRKQADLDIESWRDNVFDLRKKVVPWPLYFGPGSDADVLGQVVPEAHLPDEFSFEPLREASAVVAGRYHALMFALQCGRPAIAVSTLPKTLRFMDEHGLAEWRISEREPQKLNSMVARLEKEYHSLASRVDELRATLHEQATSQAERARDLLLTSAAALPAPGRRWGNRLRDLLDFGSYFA